MVIISFTRMTCKFDPVVILWEEIRCSSQLGFKGLQEMLMRTPLIQNESKRCITKKSRKPADTNKTLLINITYAWEVVFFLNCIIAFSATAILDEWGLLDSRMRKCREISLHAVSIVLCDVHRVVLNDCLKVWSSIVLPYTRRTLTPGTTWSIPGKKKKYNGHYLLWNPHLTTIIVSIFVWPKRNLSHFCIWNPL